jgi:hypothetical protein
MVRISGSTDVRVGLRTAGLVGTVFVSAMGWSSGTNGSVTLSRAASVHAARASVETADAGISPSRSASASSVRSSVQSAGSDISLGRPYSPVAARPVIAGISADITIARATSSSQSREAGAGGGAGSSPARAQSAEEARATTASAGATYDAIGGVSVSAARSTTQSSGVDITTGRATSPQVARDVVASAMNAGDVETTLIRATSGISFPTMMYSGSSEMKTSRVNLSTSTRILTDSAYVKRTGGGSGLSLSGAMTGLSSAKVCIGGKWKDVV